MGERLVEIQRAIDGFRMDEARALVAREIEENPSADAYYLAAQAALSHGQRADYLEKALELDPTFQGALDELADIRPPDKMAIKPEALPAPPVEQPAAAQIKLASLTKRFAAIFIDGFIVGIFPSPSWPLSALSRLCMKRCPVRTWTRSMMQSRNSSRMHYRSIWLSAPFTMLY